MSSAETGGHCFRAVRFDGMSSRIPNSHAEGADLKRLFAELAQMQPVEVDFQVFSDDEARQLRRLLTQLLNNINKHSA